MMQATARRGQHMKAGAALITAGVLAVTPIAPITPRLSGISGIDRAVQLVVDGSILNIPFNLFQDIVNIPANEVAAMDVLNSSLFFTGNWWTPSATNLWGEDPADPGHFMAVTNLLVPFPEISGLGSPEIDPEALANGTAGLGQQAAMVAAAMLPASTSCDATACLPMVPVETVTGIVAIDRLIAFQQALSDPGFGLFSNWFKVPLQDLTNGYTFPDDLANPSAGLGPDGSVPDDDVFGFPGTHLGPDGQNLEPWAGLDFKFDPLGPFQNFYNSLLAEPDLNGFQLVGLEDIGRALQSLTAALVVDFNPFVPGSPACLGPCTIFDALNLTSADTVSSIGNAWPGNQLIDHWLALNDEGLANGPTSDQVAASIAGLQVGMFQFSPADTAEVNDLLAQINPYLPNYLTNAGVLTDPAYAGWDGSEETIPPMLSPPDGLPMFPGNDPDFLGGHDPSLLWPDLLYGIDPTGGLYDELAEFFNLFAVI